MRCFVLELFKIFVVVEEMQLEDEIKKRFHCAHLPDRCCDPGSSDFPNLLETPTAAELRQHCQTDKIESETDTVSTGLLLFFHKFCGSLVRFMYLFLPNL